ncbi:iron chelate uptake ABC transporter family permease subunit [Jongsikchunia kroppenstedtii]|uniref:FecCD family ABC transporter permease n=1 Tax=Jongsikchunia kroppenstedtii TaxID=1121721 RepID=UPI0003800E1F
MTGSSARGQARFWGALTIAVLLLVAVIASIAIGSRTLSPSEVWDALWATKTAHSSDAVGIVQDLRLPRTLLGIVAGLALGAAGALSQGHTRNPMAEPGLLGVNAGAACAVVAGVYLADISSPIQYMIFGLLGAAAAVALVFVLSVLAGRMAGTAGASPMTLVLAGVGINAVLLAVTSAIVLTDSTSLDAWRFWNVGSISGRGFDVLWAAVPFVAAGLVLAVAGGFSLNVLSLGDDATKALGAKVGRVRLVGVITIALLAGAATAACGPIVFLGLAAPHIARMIVGPDYRWIVPYSAVIGAVLLLAADVLGRVLGRPGEVQSGVVLAVLGAPVFIALVRSRRLVSV